MDDRKVSVPLMVRTDDDIQFVEEDNDTVSENEVSSASKRNGEIHSQECEPVYNELAPRETSKWFLGVPKLSPLSRSTSSASSENSSLPMLLRSSSGRKKHHDYEKVSAKKSTVERITDSSFFRRRHETMLARSDKSDDEEHILEAMRHVVRKCTSIDPMKRPSSNDVLELLATFDEKS